jgi:single-strand DNA-binding protein
LDVASSLHCRLIKRCFIKSNYSFLKIQVMRNISNQVQLIGRLGAAPEIITLENGSQLTKISLATKEVYKNAKGEKVIDTQWHRLIAWGKLAENMNTYLEKGQETAISGKITYKSYVNKDGNTINYTEIVVSEFMMVGAKRKPVQEKRAA